MRCGPCRIPLPPAVSGDPTFFLVEFPLHPVFAEALKERAEVTAEVKRLIETISGEKSRRKLQELLALKHSENFLKAYLLPAIEAGLVEMTLPDKPKSRLQKYRLTENGRALQKSLKEAVQAKT